MLLCKCLHEITRGATLSFIFSFLSYFFSEMRNNGLFFSRKAKLMVTLLSQFSAFLWGGICLKFLFRQTNPTKPKTVKIHFQGISQESKFDILYSSTLGDLKLNQIWKSEVVFYGENFTIQPYVPKVLKEWWLSW